MPHRLESLQRGIGLKKLDQLLYPSAVKFRCPNCNGDIRYYDVIIYFGERWRRAPFSCSTCGSMLCVSSAYSWSVLLGWSLLALVIPSALGVRPWFLWLGTVIFLWIILGMLAGAYAKVLFPPKIMRYSPSPKPSDPDDFSLNLSQKR